MDPILNSLSHIGHFHEHQAKYPVSKETENQLAQNTPTISYLKSYDDVDVCSTFHSIDTRHIRRAIQIAFIVIFRWRLRTIVVGVSPNLVARITLVVTYAQYAWSALRPGCTEGDDVTRMVECIGEKLTDGER